jgi:vitamin-K-epoxide reductase (warfarin-sensitive)
MDKQAQKTIRRWRKCIAVLSALGFALSYYSVYVSASKGKDPNYKALCDISEHMTCSKVFTSRFGKGLGIVGPLFGEDSPLYQSNGVYGMVMYSAFVFFSLFPYRFCAKICVIMGIIANIVSAYLAYILFFIIEDICVVCISTYTIGFFLLIASLKNLSAINTLKAESSQNFSTYLDGKGTPGKKRV